MKTYEMYISDDDLKILERRDSDRCVFALFEESDVSKNKIRITTSPIEEPEEKKLIQNIEDVSIHADIRIKELEDKVNELVDAVNQLHNKE